MKSDNWFRVLVEDYIVELLPQRWQEWLDRAYIMPVELPDIEMAGTVVSKSKFKVINLMLISKSEKGDGGYYQLAVGEMSAACWEECRPVRHRIALE